MSQKLMELNSVTMLLGDAPTQVRALNQVDLTVKSGEFIAIMGPSGAGKTTLLRVISGLAQATSGTVKLWGRELTQLDENDRARLRREKIGFVFQENNLIQTLTVAENVALILELGGVKHNEALRQAGAALAKVSAADLSERYPGELSGGAQQKVAIARALLGENRLILADEPTGALDSAQARKIMEILRQQVEQNATCVMVTHDKQIAAWADRICHLKDGQIISEEKCVSHDTDKNTVIE